jgi:TetR/AcrR family transcriptional repressor of nem operon
MRTANPQAPAKKKILAAAREIMLTKGYNDTSVDEICKKSGVAKGSFFHYFKDKEALAAEALSCFIQDTGACMTQCCEGEGDPLKRIYRIIDDTIRSAKSPEFKGCLMGTVLQETARTRPRLREACCNGVEAAYGFLEKEFKAAKAKHALKSSFDPRRMAEFYMSVVQGSFLLAKAQGSPKVIEDNLKTLKEQIRETFGK